MKQTPRSNVINFPRDERTVTVEDTLTGITAIARVEDAWRHIYMAAAKGQPVVMKSHDGKILAETPAAVINRTGGIQVPITETGTDK